MTYRGLNPLTTQGARERDADVTRCINAVLEEQERQWTHDNAIIDRDRIASVSQQATRPCVETALQLAQQDELEAKEALLEDDDMIHTSTHSLISHCSTNTTKAMELKKKSSSRRRTTSSKYTSSTRGTSSSKNVSRNKSSSRSLSKSRKDQGHKLKIKKSHSSSSPSLPLLVSLQSRLSYLPSVDKRLQLEPPGRKEKNRYYGVVLKR